MFYIKYFENEYVKKVEKYYQRISTKVEIPENIMEYVQMVWYMAAFYLYYYFIQKATVVILCIV